MPINPFAASGSRPGEGLIKLSLLPPSKPVLETLSYQYPLKLIAPAAVKLQFTSQPESKDVLIHTVFLLTYGGGLVAGDAVSLNIQLAHATRLILLTQGSTKIFKSQRPDVITRQNTVVDVGDDSAICYLPDPAQPFEASVFEQKQTYHLQSERSNICVCDWVSEGRTARQENWSFHRYVSRNEVWHTRPDGTKKLLLRDNVILQPDTIVNDTIAERMENIGVFGTLMLHGPLFANLGKFFLDEFQLLPRIGSRQWDASDDPQYQSQVQRTRASRILQEVNDGLLWTVAETRGFVVVKFGSKAVEGAKRWIMAMLSADGSVEREFGERALLCVR